MSVRLSCPSCNSAFALPALPEHRRATCPRCGDVFLVRTFTEEADDGQPAPATDTREASATRTQGEGRRMVGVVLVALMGILLAGLPPFIVHWRGKKPKPAPVTPVTAKGVKPPAGLAALGYLRADCNVVFAVQPGPLLHYAEHTKQEPRDVLAQTGLPDAARTTIEQLGVELTLIDHVAGGLTLGEGENVLRLTLVLVLKQPLADEDAFLAKLKAKPVAGKKSHNDVVVGKFPMLLAGVSPTVWVFGLDEKDFAALDNHGPGGTQFRDGVRTMISAAPASAAVWLAADDDRDWTQKPVTKLVGQSAEAKKWLPAVKDGRGGLVAVSLGEKPRLKVQVRAADSATADRVRVYFLARVKEVEGAMSGGSGAFAHFEAPFDATNSGKLLQRFLSDAGR